MLDIKPLSKIPRSQPSLKMLFKIYATETDKEEINLRDGWKARDISRMEIRNGNLLRNVSITYLKAAEVQELRLSTAHYILQKLKKEG
ncbi:hypothetical protein C0J52_21938 [Blattella germanica]|nr:hypothetical protein C0J52_21938 [Blattella germanica]